MSLILRGTEGLNFPDLSPQPSAPQVTPADLAALQARLNAMDEMYKTRWDRHRFNAVGEIIFSNNDLTVTTNGPANAYRPVASYPCGFFDKVYFEATITFPFTGTPGWVGTGIGQPYGVSLTSYPGETVWGNTIFGNGEHYTNGNSSGVGVYPTIASGHTIGWAIDTAHGEWWYRNVSTNSVWNYVTNPPQDPTTPPSAIQSQACCRSPTCIWFLSYQPGASCTLNCDGPFLGQAPNGFRRWRGTPI
jgi:hypothetical protein